MTTPTSKAATPTPATATAQTAGGHALPARIVVPLDGSTFARRSVGIGHQLADRLGAELVYHRVVTDPDEALRSEDELHTAAEGWQLPAAAVAVDVGEDPAAVIVERARSIDAVVVLSSHGRGRVVGTVLGSVAEQVVRDVAAPVVVVGPDVEALHERIERLSVCLDGSDAARAALPAALAWARALAVPIELLQVLDPALGVEARDAFRDGVDVHESSYLRRVARDLADQGVTIGWEVLHDTDPAAAIVRYLQARPGSLPVLSTHSRSGLARLTLGSVATRVVRSSPAPTLLLHPDG